MRSKSAKIYKFSPSVDTDFSRGFVSATRRGIGYR